MLLRKRQFLENGGTLKVDLTMQEKMQATEAVRLAG